MNPSLSRLVRYNSQSFATSPARSVTASRQIFHPALQSFASRHSNTVSFRQSPLQWRAYFGSRRSQKNSGWVDDFAYRSPTTFVVSNVLVLTLAIAMVTKTFSDLIASVKEEKQFAEKYKKDMAELDIPTADIFAIMYKSWTDVMGVDYPPVSARASVDIKEKINHLCFFRNVFEEFIINYQRCMYFSEF